MVFREETSALKHPDRRSLSFSSEPLPPVAFMARLTLSMQRVCLCDDMRCRVLQAASHVPRVSHSLRFLHLSPSTQVSVLTEGKHTKKKKKTCPLKSGFRWKEAMWNRVSSCFRIQDYINIIRAMWSLKFTLHDFTSKTVISSEEPNGVSLKKKERGLAGHSAGSCLTIWNDWMSVV